MGTEILKKSQKLIFNSLRFIIAFLLLFYLWKSDAIDWPIFSRLLESWKLTLLPLVMLLIATALQSLRLSLIMKAMGFGLSLHSSFQLTLIGIFFNTYLPGSAGGDIVKIYYAGKGNYGQRTEVATILLLDRAIGMFSMLILPILMVPFFFQIIQEHDVLLILLWFVTFVVICIVIVVAGAYWMKSRIKWLVLKVFKSSLFGQYTIRMLDTLHEFRRLKGTLFASLALSLLAQMSTVIIFAILTLILSTDKINLNISILIPLGLLVNTIPLTPGGLGVGEAAFDKLFQMVQVNGGAEVLICWRLLLLTIGLLGLIYYLQGRQHYVHEITNPVPLAHEDPQD